MNKKIIIPLIAVLVVAGFIFLVMEKKDIPEPSADVPEQPLEKDISSVLREEIWPIYGELWLLHEEILTGKINQEEKNERLSFFENKIAELIVRHGIKTEVDEFITRRKAFEELMQWAEPRIMTINFQLEGIAEYFIQKYGIDTGIEVEQAWTLQNKLAEFSEEIWTGEISQEEIDEKLSFFEDKVAELIIQYGIQTEVDEFMIGFETILEDPRIIDPRLETILLQLQAIELYLSGTETETNR